MIGGTNMEYCSYESPIGMLRICEEDGCISRIDFDECSFQEPTSELLKEACRQLDEYFAGGRYQFQLPLLMKGTEFQLDDWNALMKIAYGETCSYQKIAEMIGRPKACRAVGMANHNNPISIVIPCHRVIGKSGKLVGYGGGLDKKIWLLNFEKHQLERLSVDNTKVVI